MTSYVSWAWSEGIISDSEFIAAIEFLIEKDVIKANPFFDQTPPPPEPKPEPVCGPGTEPDANGVCQIVEPPEPEPEPFRGGVNVEPSSGTVRGLVVDLWMDKTHYTTEDVITLFGMVEPLSGHLVTIGVANPSGNIITLAQVEPDGDGHFAIDILPEDSLHLWQTEGEYEARVQYSVGTGKTYFFFEPTIGYP